MIRYLIYSISIFVLFVSCKEASIKQTGLKFKEVHGETMGTTYHIICNCPDQKNLKKSIDSLLVAVNDEVSHYEPRSFISQVNQAPKGIIGDFTPHFKKNLLRSQYWYEQSDGYLDVSVLPLINYWGFGPKEFVAPSAEDEKKVNELLATTGLDKWGISDSVLIKNDDRQSLDFSSLAKGYGVDQVGALLKASGCTDYHVDIGGEQVMIGNSPRKRPWTIGINTPRVGAALNEAQLLLRFTGKALASSGNYRNYQVVDGRKYGHTLNPKTGYPYQDELLQVTVIADECIDADAIATACMAMGYIKATNFIKNLDGVAASFFVGEENGTIDIKYSDGFIQYVFE